MNLKERIKAATTRINEGRMPMRIPADMTDPDIVLVDCEKYIDELEAKLAESDKLLSARAAAMRKAIREMLEINSPYVSWKEMRERWDGVRDAMERSIQNDAGKALLEKLDVARRNSERDLTALHASMRERDDLRKERDALLEATDPERVKQFEELVTKTIDDWEQFKADVEDTEDEEGTGPMPEPVQLAMKLVKR